MGNHFRSRPATSSSSSPSSPPPSAPSLDEIPFDDLDSVDSIFKTLWHSPDLHQIWNKEEFGDLWNLCSQLRTEIYKLIDPWKRSKKVKENGAVVVDVILSNSKFQENFPILLT